MKCPCTAAAIVLLSGGIALAQSIGGATGPVGSGTTGPMNPNNPAGPTPIPTPSIGATEGRDPARIPAMAGTPRSLQSPRIDRPGRQQSEDLTR
jgi:hypothetical protein